MIQYDFEDFGIIVEMQDAQAYLEMYWPQNATPAGKGSPAEELRDQFRSIRLESSPEGVERESDKAFDGDYEAALQRMRYEVNF